MLQIKARGSVQTTNVRRGSGKHEKPRLFIWKRRGKPIQPRLRLALIIAVAAVFLFSATTLILDYAQRAKEANALKVLTVAVSDSTQPSDSTEAIILPQYRELHEQNADMVGWIRIDGTVIDYPVMYTQDDYYLSHAFNKEKSQSGIPYIDKRCTVEPFCTNTILYGHHMKNGTMFAPLVNYKQEDYYKQHPTIRFDTLYEQRKYEIIAVFESRIYKMNEAVFKHYNFLNAKGEADFDAYIKSIKALSLYDTGVNVSYGDELLTLVTCAYHTENGQFVVVARKAR